MKCTDSSGQRRCGVSGTLRVLRRLSIKTGRPKRRPFSSYQGKCASGDGGRARACVRPPTASSLTVWRSCDRSFWSNAWRSSSWRSSWWLASLLTPLCQRPMNRCEVPPDGRLHGRSQFHCSLACSPCATRFGVFRAAFTIDCAHWSKFCANASIGIWRFPRRTSTKCMAYSQFALNRIVFVLR